MVAVTTVCCYTHAGVYALPDHALYANYRGTLFLTSVIAFSACPGKMSSCMILFLEVSLVVLDAKYWGGGGGGALPSPPIQV